MTSRPIRAAESVTELGADVRGAVLVAGSHGGRIAAYLGAMGGAHALILNDAGVGLDGAGIAGLELLESIGMAAATVSHMSARIGDGRDSLARGVISHHNTRAAAVGVEIGMPAREAAERMTRAAPPNGAPSPYAEGRWRVGHAGRHEIWALDSVGKLEATDDGRILVIGSHGALHGGRPDSALNRHGDPVAALAVAFHDAGLGIDGIGITRLPELERRGIPAVTVAAGRGARAGAPLAAWIIAAFTAG
jgi:hypothetical protein